MVHGQGAQGANRQGGECELLGLLFCESVCFFWCRCLGICAGPQTQQPPPFHWAPSGMPQAPTPPPVPEYYTYEQPVPPAAAPMPMPVSTEPAAEVAPAHQQPSRSGHRVTPVFTKPPSPTGTPASGALAPPPTPPALAPVPSPAGGARKRVSPKRRRDPASHAPGTPGEDLVGGDGLLPVEDAGCVAASFLFFAISVVSGGLNSPQRSPGWLAAPFGDRVFW